jgi:hypothetical protein
MTLGPGRKKFWQVHLLRESEDELRRRFADSAVDVYENVHENEVRWRRF